MFSFSVQDFGDTRARTEKNRERAQNPKKLGASRLRGYLSQGKVGPLGVTPGVTQTCKSTREPSAARHGVAGCGGGAGPRPSKSLRLQRSLTF